MNIISILNNGISQILITMISTFFPMLYTNTNLPAKLYPFFAHKRIKFSVLITDIYDIPSSTMKMLFRKYVVTVFAFICALFYPQIINYISNVETIEILLVLIYIAYIFRPKFTTIPTIVIHITLLILFNIILLFFVVILEDVIHKNSCLFFLCIISTCTLEFTLFYDYPHKQNKYNRLIVTFHIISVTLFTCFVFHAPKSPCIEITSNVLIFINVIISSVPYYNAGKDKDYRIDVHIFYEGNEDITYGKIHQYTDGKVEYSTNTLTKIIEKASIDYITYTRTSTPNTTFRYKLICKFNSLLRLNRNKHTIKCQLKNGACLNYDQYRYTNNSWVIFIKNEMIKQTITYIHSSKIKCINISPID